MDLQHLVDIGLLGLGGRCLHRASASRAGKEAAEVAMTERQDTAGHTVFPKGTPLDQTAAYLSVLSYNLLAPIFVRPIDLRTGEVQPFAGFQWAEPASEVLDWSVRWPRLLKELKACRADVICLQEVQFESLDDGSFGLPPWLALDGYAARLPSRGPLQQMAERNKRVLDAEVAVGTALLYRTDRLELLDCPGIKDINTRVSACLRGRSGSALSALGKTLVSTLHLDAQSEEKRVEQMRICLETAQSLGLREVILAGDLNTECRSGSCVAALIADVPEPSEADLLRECSIALRLSGDEDEPESTRSALDSTSAPTAADLQVWADLYRKARAIPKEHRVALSQVPTGPTRAAYDHGKLSGPCVSWRLDHILYSSRTLRLRGTWTALEADAAALEAGLPNRWCPSDHLPIAAVFEVSPTPALDDDGRAALQRRIRETEERQAEEQRQLAESLDQRAPPERPSSTSQQDGEAAPPASKKAKKKGEKPSPEVIAFIQEKRRLLREQKQQHLEERQALVDAASELERDALDQLMSVAAWIESGRTDC